MGRHNGHGSVSNHQPRDCLLNRLFRRRSNKTPISASLAFVPRIHRGPVNSPHKWLVTWKMFPFDDVIMWSLNLHVGYHSGPRYFCQLRSRLSFHILRHKLPIWGRCNQTNKLFGHSMFNLSWTLLSVNGVPIYSFTGFRQHTYQQYNGDPRRTPRIAVTALPLGLYSLSGKTSYCKISWSLEADRLEVIINVSFWNLTGTSEGALPVKFKSDLKWTKKRISRLRDNTRSCCKTSYRLVNRGSGSFRFQFT